jgi:hypothetical protein
MATFGAFLCGRNDNYGEHLLERVTYSLNSLITQLDQVFFTDWNTEKGKPTVIEAIEKDLIHNGNLYWTVVDEDLAKELTPNDPEAQAVVEVLARNIGLRRLSTDYLISTNPDIVSPYRRYLDRFADERTMFTCGKRNIPRENMIVLGSVTEPEVYMAELEKLEGQYGQQPVVSIMPGDVYSLVSGCGDWQVAHKNLWYDIRGFEERLYKRGCADTNVQRKAAYWSYNIKVDWKVPVWHINHGGGMGGRGGYNDPYLATFMCGSENTETWGFSDLDLKVECL